MIINNLRLFISYFLGNLSIINKLSYILLTCRNVIAFNLLISILAERARPYLFTSDSNESTDFINAVYVDVSNSLGHKCLILELCVAYQM